MIRLVIFLFFLMISGFYLNDAFAKEYYPSIEYRVTEPPTFCTKSITGSDAKELRLSEKWIEFVKYGTQYWESELSSNSEYPEFWKIHFKEISPIMPFPDDCTVILQYEKYVPYGWEGTLGVFYAEEWWDDDPTGDDSDAGKILVFDETFGCYQSCQNFNHEKTFKEVIVHEMGHSLGLGHFTYDKSLKNVIDGKEEFPSIMYPSSIDFISDAVITQRDIKKMQTVYGTWGFYAFSENRPTGIISEDTEIIEGILPQQQVFSSIEISDEKINKPASKYDKKFITVSGKLVSQVSGHITKITLQLMFPDNSIKIYEVPYTSNGEFQLLLEVDETFPIGKYVIEPSYRNESSQESNIRFEIVSGDEIIEERIIEEEIPMTVEEMFPTYGYEAVLPHPISLNLLKDNKVSGYLVEKGIRQKQLSEINLYLFLIINNYETMISSTTVDDDLSFEFQITKKDLEAWENSLPDLYVTGFQTTSIDSGQIMIESKVRFDKIYPNKADSASQKVNFNRISLVPDWIKNNAKWWADGQVDDSTFSQGIGFLIKEKIISISATSPSTSFEETIPDWIKNNAKWWADGMISEDDFLRGITYMVEKGIVKVK